MTSSSSRYIKLQIQYGSDVYEILLKNKEENLRVEHILDEIEKILKVPKCHQSIIYKGQRLDQKPKANLTDLYIFNNSKLILKGTQKQFHDKYCCPDHDHQITFQQQNHTNIKTENSKKNIDDSLITKKQEISSNLTGFIPEPNKNYEYYTVPYKTDPTTLFQTIPPSTSNVH